MSSDNTTETINNVVKQGLRKKAFWAGRFSDNDTSPDHAPFSVDFKGRVVMKQAQIGGAFGDKDKVWIKDGTIYTENVQQEDGTRKNHNSFASTYKGFYIGPDGISLGGWFKVDNQGELTARRGYIGNSTNGFWINDENIHSNGKDEAFSNKKGVFLGIDKIALGPNAKFYVSDEGYLKAVHGTIAGWTINENAIYRDTIHNDYGPMKAKRDKDGKIVKNKDGKTVLIYGDKPYEDGLYFGKGGLRMGGNFHVDSQGNLYAINGNFAGKITSSEGNIAGWTLSSSSLTGGSMKINSNGSMSGKNWSITADGKASFSNANILQIQMLGLAVELI